MDSTINTIEKAFIADGTDIKLMPDVSHLKREKDQQAIINNYKADVVIRALNSEGQEKEWEPDYSDPSQIKYENWYVFSPSSGWSLLNVVIWHAHTRSCSRRAFRTRAIARYFAETFPELVNAIL
ncbi:hypothetical protein [Flavobacterium denitrificans]|uniref:hypothetical protein n=1 Tax=Flavobacterium denitrificans TaxID=281361 RepID=UPI000428F913|nr:hypothetical protein [Flavobacterium denitrificans]